MTKEPKGLKALDESVLTEPERNALETLRGAAVQGRGSYAEFFVTEQGSQVQALLQKLQKEGVIFSVHQSMDEVMGNQGASPAQLLDENDQPVPDSFVGILTVNDAKKLKIREVVTPL